MQITAAHKKAIDHYYQELETYHDHKVSHETAVRSAFQYLLATFARSANWTLIPEQILENGKRPDGTMRDTFNLPRGYWEAKDTKDDLKTEIRKKITLGYPITNTIFEDTRHAILYQNNKQVLEVDLAKPKELTDVLDQFFSYTEPDIVSFEAAVKEFKERVPELAGALLVIIEREYTQNKKFIDAFNAFTELCRTGACRVIPILLRPTDWEGAPFSHLQMLPTDTRSVAVSTFVQTGCKRSLYAVISQRSYAVSSAG